MGILNWMGRAKVLQQIDWKHNVLNKIEVYFFIVEDFREICRLTGGREWGQPYFKQAVFLLF